MAAHLLTRIHALAADKRVENIVITGRDRRTLELLAGTRIPGPARLGINQELVDVPLGLTGRSRRWG